MEISTLIFTNVLTGMAFSFYFIHNLLHWFKGWRVAQFQSYSGVWLWPFTCKFTSSIYTGSVSLSLLVNFLIGEPHRKKTHSQVLMCANTCIYKKLTACNMHWWCTVPSLVQLSFPFNASLDLYLARTPDTITSRLVNDATYRPFKPSCSYQ